MDDQIGWAKPFIAMYAFAYCHSDFEPHTGTSGKNKGAKSGDALIRQLNWDDCLIRAKQNGLLTCLHQGKPFTLANPLLFRPPVHFIFQPQTDKEGLLQGVLVHIFQDTNVSSPEWKESMYQPANVYNNQFRMPLSQIFLF